MQLKHILQAAHPGERLIGRARPALPHTIVHDGYPRLECREHAEVSLVAAAVVGDEVDADRSHHVLRTSQSVERLTAQVPHVEKSELAEADDDSSRARILVGILRRD